VRIYILTNALEYGDAVSNHCLLLRQRAGELGIPALLCAEFADDRVREQLSGPPELLDQAAAEDILFHQLFNETPLMSRVERFPGRRVLMYHNITPPEYFSKDNPVFRTCLRGLRQVRAASSLYDYAVGMTEFSRRDLESLGYPHTGVFPLLLDTARLLRAKVNPVLMGLPKPRGTVFLFVGRMAPNKRIEDLLRFLAAYRRLEAGSVLVLVGNDAQHPEYVQSLHRLATSLGLRAGMDVVFTGKVSEEDLATYYLRADAYISMSEHEGFCAPLLESMACGLPTFAYAIPAVEETMGGAGVLFREKDFSALANLVWETLQDPARRQGVLERQRLRLEDFSPERQRERLRALIEKVRPLRRPPRARPLVTVIINTCNRARQLERCLAALGEQTYRDFEVVVVNGPSQDDTAALLDSYADKIERAQVSSRVLSVSRNQGIAHSLGELIAFIDDDAVPHPQWLEELVVGFDAPDVGAAGGLVYRMHSGDIEFRNGIIDRQGFVRWDEPAPGMHWDWEEGYLNTVSGNNCMFRRSALEQIGGFDERIEYYHDEADVILRLHRAGFRTVHRPQAIVYHEAAGSHNRRSPYHLNWFAIAKNTVYCAVKNADRGRRWKLGLQVAARVVRERIGAMVVWRREGRIGTLDLLWMAACCSRGIAVGMALAILARPRYRDLKRGAERAAKLFPASPPRHMRVALLSQNLPADSPGGIASYTVALARGLRELGCEVHVVHRDDRLRSVLRDGVWYHGAAPIPFPAEVLEGYRLPTVVKNLEYSNGVRAKLLDIQARWGLDLLESPNWDFEGLLAALERRLPVVVRTHSPMFQVALSQNWLMNQDLELCAALEGTLLRHADAVTGSTRAILELVARQYPVSDKQVLVPLGLDIPAAGAKLARQPQANVMILFVGRLEARKGIDTLLEALPEVLRAFPSASVHIAGRDCGAAPGLSWEQLWQSRMRGQAQQGQVRFHGEVSNEVRDQLYEACDIFVAPSRYESFGLIYLEAMARGKPVIACRVGGVPEVVVDGETGILVPPGDPAALAAAILRLLRDPEQRERLGRAGHERYRSLFTSQAMAARTLALYRDVVRRWEELNRPVWRASAVEVRRHSGCHLVWVPESRNLCLLVPEGLQGIAVYGPYIRLAPGSYRVEFKLWLGAAPPPRRELGKLDVCSLRLGYEQKKPLWTEDFTAGPGSVFNLFFTVPDPAAEDYEFRLHTTGCVPIYLREISVHRWPPKGVPLPRSGAEVQAAEVVQL